MLEVTVALALLAIVGAIIAQSIVWSLRERQRIAMQYAATEIASNALEEARAVPIEQLTQAWADAQTLPSEVAGTLPQGKLLVTVESLKDAPLAKRVIAEVRWQLEPDMPTRSVTLATVFSARVAPKSEGQP
jgi:type II secretory pathway pseudopilin PulG